MSFSCRKRELLVGQIGAPDLSIRLAELIVRVRILRRKPHSGLQLLDRIGRCTLSQKDLAHQIPGAGVVGPRLEQPPEDRQCLGGLSVEIQHGGQRVLSPGVLRMCGELRLQRRGRFCQVALLQIDRAQGRIRFRDCR